MVKFTHFITKLILVAAITGKHLIIIEGQIIWRTKSIVVAKRVYYKGHINEGKV
jgi:hypothetical protein